MNKPNVVNILGANYKILYVEKPSDVDYKGRDSLWGQIDPWTNTIRIYENGNDIGDIWDSIWHEILHGIALKLDIDEINKSKNEEHIIKLLALGVADTLTRNGWLKE